MQDENNIEKRMGSGSTGRSGLLAKIRNRTESEQDLSSSVGGSPYATAALGQAPYVAMGNGVIVVQRRCTSWNC